MVGMAGLWEIVAQNPLNWTSFFKDKSASFVHSHEPTHFLYPLVVSHGLENPAC